MEPVTMDVLKKQMIAACIDKTNGITDLDNKMASFLDCFRQFASDSNMDWDIRKPETIRDIVTDEELWSWAIRTMGVGSVQWALGDYVFEALYNSVKPSGLIANYFFEYIAFHEIVPTCDSFKFVEAYILRETSKLKPIDAFTKQRTETQARKRPRREGELREEEGKLRKKEEECIGTEELLKEKEKWLEKMLADIEKNAKEREEIEEKRRKLLEDLGRIREEEQKANKAKQDAEEAKQEAKKEQETLSEIAKKEKEELSVDKRVKAIEERLQAKVKQLEDLLSKEKEMAEEKTKLRLKKEEAREQKKREKAEAQERKTVEQEAKEKTLEEAREKKREEQEAMREKKRIEKEEEREKAREKKVEAEKIRQDLKEQALAEKEEEQKKRDIAAEEKEKDREAKRLAKEKEQEEKQKEWLKKQEEREKAEQEKERKREEKEKEQKRKQEELEQRRLTLDESLSVLQREKEEIKRLTDEMKEKRKEMKEIRQRLRKWKSIDQARVIVVEQEKITHVTSFEIVLKCGHREQIVVMCMSSDSGSVVVVNSSFTIAEEYDVQGRVVSILALFLAKKTHLFATLSDRKVWYWRTGMTKFAEWLTFDTSKLKSSKVYARTTTRYIYSQLRASDGDCSIATVDTRYIALGITQRKLLLSADDPTSLVYNPGVIIQCPRIYTPQKDLKLTQMKEGTRYVISSNLISPPLSVKDADSYYYSGYILRVRTGQFEATHHFVLFKCNRVDQTPSRGPSIDNTKWLNYLRFNNLTTGSNQPLLQQDDIVLDFGLVYVAFISFYIQVLVKKSGGRETISLSRLYRFAWDFDSYKPDYEWKLESAANGVRDSVVRATLLDKKIPVVAGELAHGQISLRIKDGGYWLLYSVPLGIGQQYDDQPFHDVFYRPGELLIVKYQKPSDTQRVVNMDNTIKTTDILEVVPAMSCGDSDVILYLQLTGGHVMSINARPAPEEINMGTLFASSLSGSPLLCAKTEMCDFCDAPITMANPLVSDDLIFCGDTCRYLCESSYKQ